MRLLPLLVILMVISACSQPQPTENRASAPVNQAAPSASAAPKVVTIALTTELSNFGAPSGEPQIVGQHANMLRVAQDELLSRTEGGGSEPRMAVERPSTDRGTWVINADGTMDTTFKLRPNIKWHDGTPFTSEDLVFHFTVFSDPELVPKRLGSGRGRPDLMQSVTAPDPLTFIVRWSQVYVRADEADGISSLPKHLLGDLYLQDKQALARSPYFFDEFVGTGAYKLDRWERGSHMEFSRFNDYYLGRPKLDRVIFRFTPDSNTLIANILSGNVDVVIPEEGDVDAAFEIRQRWEGTGNQVRFDLLTGLDQLQMQHQVQFARPVNGFPARGVRQAMYRALDRKALADLMTQGVSSPADSWYAPNDPLRKDVESAIPQFPFDTAAALRQLEQEGWTRGSDGVLVHSPSGERFESEMTVRTGAAPLREGQAIADYWKSIGAVVQVKQLTPATSAPEPFATQPGPSVISPSGYNFYDRRLHSLGIPAAQNRWTGNNRGGYNSPKVDALLDKLAVTIGSSERIALHRELLQEQMGDVALMPLYWQVAPILMVKGISGPKFQGSEATPNIYEWDKS